MSNLKQDLVAVISANNERIIDYADDHYVAQEEGKGLSSNDFTTAEKEKLAALNSAANTASLDNNGKIPVSQLPDSVRAVEVVANYSALLALTNNFDGRKVYVLDAAHGTATEQDPTGRVNGDQTVESGAAEYIYVASTTSFAKTSEGESLDVITQWDNVQNKPLAFTPSDHASNKVNAMTGYSKPQSLEAGHENIEVTDSLNTAIGKLEKKVDSINSELGDTSASLTEEDIADMMDEIWGTGDDDEGGEEPEQNGEGSGE